MSCNCTTNEQIKSLYEQFGNKSELPEGSSVWKRVKHYGTVAAVTVAVITLTPFLFIYVIYKGFSKDKRISLAEFFGFREKIVKENV